MAHIEYKELADGTATAKVCWTDGGRGGKRMSVTFNPKDGPDRNVEHAKVLCAIITANGNRTPENFVPGYGVASSDVFARAKATAGALLADEAASSVPDFEQVALEWFDSRQDEIEDSTLLRYEQALRRNIIPHFKGVPACDGEHFGEQAMKAWMRRLRHGVPAEDDQEQAWVHPPLAKSTTANVLGVAKVLFNSMVARGLLTANPCKNLKVPGGGRRAEMVFLEPAEFALIEAELDEDARAFAGFLYRTGARFNEGTAVRVEDVQLKPAFTAVGRFRPQVAISHTWKYGRRRGWYLGETKTDSSDRKLTLSKRDVAGLEPLTAGRAPGELVFRRPDGHPWRHSTFHTGRWFPAVYRAMRCEAHRAQDAQAGIHLTRRKGYKIEHLVWCGCEGRLTKRPRIHDLRHSHVACLIALGVEPLAISRRLGHSKIGITMDTYGHLLDQVVDDMTGRLDAMLDQAERGGDES